MMDLAGAGVEPLNLALRHIDCRFCCLMVTSYDAFRFSFLGRACCSQISECVGRIVGVFCVGVRPVPAPIDAAIFEFLGLSSRL